MENSYDDKSENVNINQFGHVSLYGNPIVAVKKRRDKRKTYDKSKIGNSAFDFV